MSHDLILVAMGLTCFVAATLNAALATGGIYILIAVSTSLMPVSVAIPLLPVFAFGSLMGRCLLFRRAINWSIAVTFSIGALLGAVLGARVFVALSDSVIGGTLGLLLLAMIWFPRTRWQLPMRHPYLPVGLAHTFISTVFGAGAVLQSVLIRTDLDKAAVTATLAACTVIMEVFKVSGYISVGFDYTHYPDLLLVATLAGLVGSWLGRRLANRIPDTWFRPLFKGIISLVAVKLLWQSLV